ncbi:MAG: hypothetical protein KJZ93_22745, partial [Caldilineaceae bacterium]|nr:hypothetical protein [Caldilineaceae bacterium]
TTHQDLANRLGVKRYTVDLWARATNPALPSADNLERLCRWLEARQPGLSRQFVAAAFNAAWDRGSALAIDETVALALSIDGQCPRAEATPV